MSPFIFTIHQQQSPEVRHAPRNVGLQDLALFLLQVCFGSSIYLDRSFVCFTSPFLLSPRIPEASFLGRTTDAAFLWPFSPPQAEPFLPGPCARTLPADLAQLRPK